MELPQLHPLQLGWCKRLQSKYSKIQIDSYLYIPRAELRNYESAKWLLTVQRKFDKEHVELFDDSRPGWFGVPLFHFRKQFHDLAHVVEDTRTPGKQTSFLFKSSLRDEQIPVIAKFEKEYGAGRTGFILEAPPGAGKTVMILKMLETIGRSALIVVPRSNLVDQWVDRVVEHTSIKRGDIGIAMEGRCDYVNKKIVVGLVHSLVLNRYGDAFKRAFGVVVYDEVDRSVPPRTFAPALSMFPCLYRIGCSATMKRQDGMEIVFEKALGQTMLHCSSMNRLKPHVLCHRFSMSSGRVFAGSETLNRRGMLISRLASNPFRNQLIADYARLIVKSGRRCVVMSDRTQQLMILREILVSNGELSGKDVGLYVRRVPSAGSGAKKYKEMTARERSRNAIDCKILLATFGMMQLGTDIPDLAGLIFATPQSEIEQTKGRIERVLEGKKTPVMIDIVDEAYPDAVRWADKRLRSYRLQGLSIKYVRS